MQFETRVTWEKLLLEIRNLQPEDCSSLVPLMVGTNAVITPKEPMEGVFRQVHFLSFEINQLCEGLPEHQRWEKLRQFFFETKGFKTAPDKWSELREKDLLLRSILESRNGHPLPVTLLFLHLALTVGLQVTLVQARQQFILKRLHGSQSFYIDILQDGRILSDCEVFQMLQRSSSNLEIWDARLIYRRYLEELMRLYEQQSQTQLLHSIYNLCLHLDDSNLPVLARRALLRHRMGFAREALTDLKRYFSFVDRGHAPIELQKAMVDLESVVDDSHKEAKGLLH